MRWILCVWLAGCAVPETPDERPLSTVPDAEDSAVPAAPSEPGEPGDTAGPDARFDRTTWPDSLGGDRPARVFAPSGWDGETLLPVVVLLHGYSVTAAFQDRLFHLSSRVDRAGFLMILPQGHRDRLGLPYWNATPACCDTFNEQPDDEGYLRDLLLEAEQRFPVDPDRITFVGHSNGGFMAYRMACAYPDRIAGIASLAGLSYRNPGSCDAELPVSVLQIHGTDDHTIPYDQNLIYGGAQETAAWWADLAGCDPTPVAGDRADYDTLTPGDETVPYTWTGCGGPQVELWKMEGGGHIPGLTADFTDDLVHWLLAQRR